MKKLLANLKKGTAVFVMGMLFTAGIVLNIGCSGSTEIKTPGGAKTTEDDKTSKEQEEPENYTFTTKKIGGPDSAYTVYVFDTELTGKDDDDIARYLKKNKAYVQTQLDDFVASLADADQATKNYFAPYIANVKRALTCDDIHQETQMIYDGAEYIFTDMIQYQPKTGKRTKTCYFTEIILNEPYGKGFGSQTPQMAQNYQNKIGAATTYISCWGINDEELRNDIKNNDCIMTVAYTDEFITGGIPYMNEANGTNVKLPHIQKVINIAGTAKTNAAMLDFMPTKKAPYLSLDKKMENAIYNPKTITQSQNQNMGIVK